MSYWDKILDGFDFKTKAGAPSNAQFKNPNDRMLLRMELLKKGWPENVVNEYLYEIDLVRKKQDDGTYGSDYAVKQFNPGRGQKLVKKDASAQDVKKALGVKDDDDLQKGKDEKPKRDDVPKKKNKPKNSTIIDQNQIDEFDEDSKKGGLNKTIKAPGNDASTVNEIGVGYAVACLDAGGNTDQCLIDKFKGTKLEKKILKESTRKEIFQSAKAERKRLNDHMNNPNNPLDSKTTKVAHIWGSKESLSGAVNGLQKKKIKVVNGIPFDGDENKLFRKKPNGKFELDKDGKRIPLPVEFGENGKPKNYAQVILNGGAGDDPTDTQFIMTDDNGNCEILHSSNKTTTQDLQANGSPYNEINSISESAKKDKNITEKSHKEIDKLDEETGQQIKKIRNDQKDYVSSHVSRFGKRLKDDKTRDYILARLENGENDNPRGLSTTKGKYLGKVLKHKKVKKAMVTKYGKDWETAIQDPNDERYMDDVMKQEIMNFYIDGLQSDIKEGIEMRNDDVQIISRLFGKTKANVVENGQVKMKPDGSGPITKSVHGEEDMLGEKIPDGPDKFDQKSLNDYYNKQTQVINNHRLKLNDIGEKEGTFGLGDYHHTQRMISRLHLNLADEHNPGGIPHDRFALNMGVLNTKGAIKKDKDGNFLSKQKDGKYYKWNETTKKWNDGPFEGKSSELLDNDCAVMADGKTHRDCLGLKENEKLEDGFKIKYETINASVDSEGQIVDFGGSDTASVEAIIYDRNDNVVAVQTCRSKSGPGGSVNDTINWHPDYQKCMAEHTITNGKCG
jgi:hypothetical protein